jgi:hypothetical protein
VSEFLEAVAFGSPMLLMAAAAYLVTRKRG